MSDDLEWTEEEQRKLEEGLVQTAAVGDLKERWQQIARHVGNKSAKACAERFRACRARALAKAAAQEEQGDDEEGEEEDVQEEDEEEQEFDVEEQEEEEEEQEEERKEQAEPEGEAQGRGKGKGKKRGKETAGKDDGRWQDKWQQDGWQGGRWQSWRGGGSWKSGGSWDANSSWGRGWDGQSWNDSGGGGWSEKWVEEGAQEEKQEDKEEDEKNLTEEQRRALEIKREVEANRERMRLREERKAADEQRKEAKAAAEREEREKKQREQREAQERKHQEIAEQRLRKQQEEEEQRRRAQEAAKFSNPAFGSARAKTATAGKLGGWAAKASAAQKGQMMRQRKQEELERRSAEVLANIGSAKSKPGAAAAAAAAPAAAAAAADDFTEEAVEQERAPAQVAASSSRKGPRAPIGPRRGPNVAEEPEAFEADAAAKSDEGARKPNANPKAKAKMVPSPATGPPAAKKDKQSKRKRWWHSLDSDCPISLAPLAELPGPPFGLEAGGSVGQHYFDARFLASYLLSSCDFIDPVNRRPLTFEECQALENHLLHHFPLECGDTCVADAFRLFELNTSGGNGEQTMHGVQREATAVLQHLFRFRSARRTDQRGRAVNYNDGGLTVVDDDDILTAGPAAPPNPFPPERSVSAEYPSLGGRGGGQGASSSASGAWRGPPGGRGGEAYPSLPGAKSKPKAGGAPPPSAKAKSGGQGSTGRGGGGKGGGRGNVKTGSAWGKPPK